VSRNAVARVKRVAAADRRHAHPSRKVVPVLLATATDRSATTRIVTTSTTDLLTIVAPNRIPRRVAAALGRLLVRLPAHAPRHLLPVVLARVLVLHLHLRAVLALVHLVSLHRLHAARARVLVLAHHLPRLLLHVAARVRVLVLAHHLPRLLHVAARARVRVLVLAHHLLLHLHAAARVLVLAHLHLHLHAAVLALHLAFHPHHLAVAALVPVVVHDEVADDSATVTDGENTKSIFAKNTVMPS
jgi:hypothetical protein